MSDRALPDGWTIHTRPALGLTALTLHDDDGEFCQTDYHEQTSPPAHRDACTVLRALDNLPAPHVYRALDKVPVSLRDAAQALLNGYFERLAQTQADAAALRQAIPDFDALTNRLRRAVPDCHTDAYRDDQTGLYSLVLAATGAAAGRLLTLLATWPHAARASDDELPDGVTADLATTTTLTVTLDTRRTRDFLDWYRGDSGLPVDFDAADTARRAGEAELAARMAACLREIGVEADTANTGSTCWVAVVALSERLHLEVFFPEGEGWSWTLHCDGEQIDVGYWSTTSTTEAAGHIANLKESLGATVG
ncbi:hypothetical protein [Streptomyces sp. S1D4-20]|uniref:hypothetical protein n=1 Tax=Streptomyces sp. S1D4-20 TaxID=2594462 RepID=UPI0011636826|nr:hypothetical protein [Streptomyces sp. S1D4-20]QDN54080.1 hypothetical protein FNV67_00425 [Streptomyces sp. S1D4-20]